ncbi:RTA1 like protein-domain-containing protein [Thelonectria olida]|uniref:RTA1 like protein-domain-containing protein n=1 Tax=Thelonectria olida TaxID=1576542 RepID=A0A9P9ARZ3_9HYPO|nr:RTA1 like protein-domain-containing protein [Thelonectria olida]
MDTLVARIATEPDGKLDFKLYRYTPSLPVAIVATIIFGILTCLHTWRLRRACAWYFIPFTVGGLCYAGRIVSHGNKESVPAYSVQAILILVAPALFAASIYMILGRIITSLHAQHLSLIPVQRLTKLFVCSDIMSFSLQAAGGGIQASGTIKAYNTGEKIILAGLFAQIAIFGFFVLTSVLFHYRCNRQPTPKAQQNTFPWQQDLWVLYTISILILVRSIFRVVEYLQGNDGYLISHEVFLYIFDAILMAIVMVVFLIFYVDHLDNKRSDDHEIQNCVVECSTTDLDVGTNGRA